MVSSTFHEYVGNMHMHTPYSDGAQSHEYIAKAAQLAGIDFVIATDHNILVQGVEGYYGDETTGHVLVLTGEEIHDRRRQPPANHMLVYGAESELANCAHDPQTLINAVNVLGGLTFLAHPHDQDVHVGPVHEPAIPWIDWQVQNYTGLEIWNYMSSVKELLTSPLRAVRAIFRPEDYMLGPHPETLALWDKLLSQGLRVVGIGNSDAHGIKYRFGALVHTVYPYDFLFSCVNSHILTPQPFSGDWTRDKQAIYRALRNGNVFIGYDLLGSTRGFRFSAYGDTGTAIMGGVIRMGTTITLQAIAPARCNLRIIKDGKVVVETSDRENLTFTAREAGAYRVEAFRNYKGKLRTWILSNPIYVEDQTFNVQQSDNASSLV